MKQVRLSVVTAITAVAMGLTACDWDFGGSADQTNEAHGAVEFSGLYTGIGGGDLISNYTWVADFPIVHFNVSQDGNDLRVMDNNGSVYTGKLGNVRFTGPTQNWTQAFAQFSVRGRNNNSGKDVTITGTLQAERPATAVQRHMFGTWLEAGGLTGEVRGRAEDIVVQ